MWIRETRIEKKEKKIKKDKNGGKEQEWQGWHEAHLHKELETSCNDRYVGRYGQVQETHKKKDTKVEKRRGGKRDVSMATALVGISLAGGGGGG